MGADITIKQNDNDLEFNKIKGRPNEVYMHRRHVRHHPSYKCPPPGNDGTQSHYHGEIDIPSEVKDKNGNVYTVTQLGKINEPVMDQATDLKTVSIPGTVKTIYTLSFSGCIRLISVKLNEGLKEIDLNSAKPL